MMHTLVGPAKFRQAIDLYFREHDGQAVTTDALVAAVEEASGEDLSQFRLWYEQSGTPRLAVRDQYDEASQTYVLTVTQSCPPTPGQPTKKPMHMPLTVGLLTPDGRELPLRLEGEKTGRGGSAVLS